MDYLSTSDILTFLLGAIGGAGGLAGITSFFVRPRVYARSAHTDVVHAVSASDQGRVEKLLQEQGLPTAVFNVDWWNEGRRAAEDITVEVLIPGGFVGYRAAPDAASASGAWAVNVKPVGPDTLLTLTQRRLMPDTYCVLIVDYHRGARRPKAKLFRQDRGIPWAFGAANQVLPPLPVAGPLAAGLFLMIVASFTPITGGSWILTLALCVIGASFIAAAYFMASRFNRKRYRLMDALIEDLSAHASTP